MDFNLFNHKVLSINLYKKDVIIGIGSKVDEDNHVLFLDLDNKTEDESYSIIKELQNKYHLGSALLLRSSLNNYHGVFFDKMNFEFMIKIQKEVNLKHGCMTEMKGESTLRLSSKFGNIIVFCGIIGNMRKSSFIQSRTMFNAFCYYFKLDKKLFTSMFFDKDKFFDKSADLFCYEKRLKIW